MDDDRYDEEEEARARRMDGMEAQRRRQAGAEDEYDSDDSWLVKDYEDEEVRSKSVVRWLWGLVLVWYMNEPSPYIIHRSLNRLNAWHGSYPPTHPTPLTADAAAAARQGAADGDQRGPGPP